MITKALYNILKDYLDLINIVIFLPNNKLLISTSGDHIIRLWDVIIDVLYNVLKNYLSWINIVIFLLNDKLLVSVLNNYIIKL